VHEGGERREAQRTAQKPTSQRSVAKAIAPCVKLGTGTAHPEVWAWFNCINIQNTDHNKPHWHRQLQQHCERMCAPSAFQSLSLHGMPAFGSSTRCQPLCKLLSEHPVFEHSVCGLCMTVQLQFPSPSCVSQQSNGCIGITGSPPSPGRS
jgi:hypothetical protein